MYLDLYTVFLLISNMNNHEHMQPCPHLLSANRSTFNTEQWSYLFLDDPDHRVPYEVLGCGMTMAISVGDTEHHYLCIIDRVPSFLSQLVEL